MSSTSKPGNAVAMQSAVATSPPLQPVATTIASSIAQHKVDDPPAPSLRPRSESAPAEVKAATLTRPTSKAPKDMFDSFRNTVIIDMLVRYWP